MCSADLGCSGGLGSFEMALIHSSRRSFVAPAVGFDLSRLQGLSRRLQMARHQVDDHDRVAAKLLPAGGDLAQLQTSKP